MNLNPVSSLDAVHCPRAASIVDHLVDRTDNLESRSLEQLVLHSKQLYWSFTFLNFVVLWAYQTLISAQNYYASQFPEARLEFYGTVALSIPMLCMHCGTVWFSFDQRFGFR
jgi:equilibrative nucleoside transporter 1/2/3